MSPRCLLSLGLLSLSLLPAIARADENYFGYTYGAETLPAGADEAYLWVTQRNGKGAGEYRATDVQIEWEHGFSNHFQASFYLTGRAYDYSGGAILDEDGAPVNKNTSLDFDGAKVEMKWNLKNPARHGYGLALYLETEYGRIHRPDGERFKEWGLEGKLILQKNFLDGKIVTAYNLTLEPEWENEGAEWERELAAAGSAGISYRFAPGWFAGVEARLDGAYPEYEELEFWSLSAGPTLHYASKRWWTTLTWLPQIRGGPTDAARSTRLHLEERERSELRLKLGFNF